MNNIYDLHSYSKLYREEALREARMTRLARKDGRRLGLIPLLLMMVVLAPVVLLGAGCTDPASSTVDTDTNAPDHTASDTSGSSASASPSSDAARFAGMRSSGSWECYTFYSDGTVELRHGGTSAVNDTGSYQGDEDFGEIVWDSGRWTSTVVAEGDGLIIDDLKVSSVRSCY
jgi:hypothetical protein